MKKKKPSKRKPAKKKQPKSPGKSPAGELVPQKHGGAIRSGSLPGNTAGPGRPPSAIRAALAQSFDVRRHIYESVADGEATERIEMDFKEMLPYLLCGTCGADPIIRKDTPVDRIVIQAWRSARTRDRLRAMDSMGKLGIGEAKVVDFVDIRQHPEAQRFMHCYHEALTSELSEAVAQRVIKKVDELLQQSPAATS